MATWTAPRLVELDQPYNLVATLSALRQGPADPTMLVAGATVTRALRTAEGPTVLELTRCDAGVAARATGPGAAAALVMAPALAGGLDEPGALVPLHPAVRDAVRRRPGLRLTAGTALSHALVWAVLAQKVVGADARRAYRDLVRALAEPAPGDLGLLLPPDPVRLAATPPWVFHRCNIEMRRAGVIVECARRSSRLDALMSVPAAEARDALQSIPGIGPWTAAVVTGCSHGDPDAVPLGDYHIPNAVTWALAGEPRGDDDRMLELLEPYRGQRGRVIRLLMSGGRGAPRWGPPMPRRSIARL